MQKHLAETVRGRARHEKSPALRAEWEHLAEIYSQLAEQTDPNEPLDPVWGSGVSYLGWFTPLARWVEASEQSSVRSRFSLFAARFFVPGFY